jgi:hypothetical protein
MPSLEAAMVEHNKPIKKKQAQRKKVFINTTFKGFNYTIQIVA